MDERLVSIHTVRELAAIARHHASQLVTVRAYRLAGD
jgi:hypothetical protein